MAAAVPDQTARKLSFFNGQRRLIRLAALSGNCAKPPPPPAAVGHGQIPTAAAGAARGGTTRGGWAWADLGQSRHARQPRPADLSEPGVEGVGLSRPPPSPAGAVSIPPPCPPRLPRLPNLPARRRSVLHLSFSFSWSALVFSSCSVPTRGRPSPLFPSARPPFPPPRVGTRRSRDGSCRGPPRRCRRQGRHPRRPRHQNGAHGRVGRGRRPRLPRVGALHALGPRAADAVGHRRGRVGVYPAPRRRCGRRRRREWRRGRPPPPPPPTAGGGGFRDPPPLPRRPLLLPHRHGRGVARP